MNDQPLEVLIEAIRSIEERYGPPLKSVTMHPDDFAALRLIAKERATTPNLDSDEMFGPLRYDGVPIYQSEHVPKGRPFYDPPEAMTGYATRSTSATNVMHRDLKPEKP